MTNSNRETAELLGVIERELEQMLNHQREKAAKVARQHMPNVTSEDLLNPDNFPAIIQDPAFTYEDGCAAGILSAQIALRRIFRSYCSSAE